MNDLQKIVKEIKNNQNKSHATILQRFFKTGPGQYGAGDMFLGLKVPVQRLIARKYTNLPFKDIETLLASKFHEFRMIGLLILIDKYQETKDRIEHKKIVDFYLAHTSGINNWDLVDLSVYKLLGVYLLAEKDADKVLNKLAESKNLWERRMAMIATYAFIKEGQAKHTLVLAKKLLHDEHDLMHKAVGWMLRESGKRVNKQGLTDFLDKYAHIMPRMTLRYAIEKLSPTERERYRLQKKAR